MAASLFRTARFAAPSSRVFSQTTVRPMHVSHVLAAGKESALHNEGRAEEAEFHKQDQLAKQKQGKGHWKDELASDSESIVKADRGEVDASSGKIEQLQKESARAAEKAHKSK